MKRMRLGSSIVAAVVVLSTLARPGVVLAQPASKAFIFDPGSPRCQQTVSGSRSLETRLEPQ